MTQCAICGVDYPDELVHQMAEAHDGQLTYTPVCGICALERRNATLGTADTRFSGELAELARLMAVDYRRRHGIG